MPNKDDTEETISGFNSENYTALDPEKEKKRKKKQDYCPPTQYTIWPNLTKAFLTLSFAGAAYYLLAPPIKSLTETFGTKNQKIEALTRGDITILEANPPSKTSKIQNSQKLTSKKIDTLLKELGELDTNNPTSQNRKNEIIKKLENVENLQEYLKFIDTQPSPKEPSAFTPK